MELFYCGNQIYVDEGVRLLHGYSVPSNLRMNCLRPAIITVSHKVSLSVTVFLSLSWRRSNTSPIDSIKLQLDRIKICDSTRLNSSIGSFQSE